MKQLATDPAYIALADQIEAAQSQLAELRRSADTDADALTVFDLSQAMLRDDSRLNQMRLNAVAQSRAVAAARAEHEAALLHLAHLCDLMEAELAESEPIAASRAAVAITDATLKAIQPEYEAAAARLSQANAELAAATDLADTLSQRLQALPVKLTHARAAAGHAQARIDSLSRELRELHCQWRALQGRSPDRAHALAGQR